MENGYEPEVYTTEAWFKSLAWQHHWIEKMVGWWVGEFGLPPTVGDFGAGDGWWCKAFHDLGSQVTAAELDEIAIKFIPEQVQVLIHDLRLPMDTDLVFHQTICLEVAEHLPPSSTEIFCKTLGTHTTNILMFSAAGLDQPGTGHINLRPQRFWQTKLEPWGLKFDAEMTRKTRRAFSNIVNDLFEFLPKNIQIFRKQP